MRTPRWDLPSGENYFAVNVRSQLIIILKLEHELHFTIIYPLRPLKQTNPDIFRWDIVVGGKSEKYLRA